MSKEYCLIINHPLADYFNLSMLLAQGNMLEKLQEYHNKRTIKVINPEYFRNNTPNTLYDLNKGLEKKLFKFDTKLIQEVDLFSWNHGMDNHDWQGLIKEEYLMLVEIPLYEKTHHIINNLNCKNENVFVYSMLDFIKERERCFNPMPLHSVYKLIKVEPRPVVIGISQKTNDLKEREFALGRNILQVLYAVQEKIDRKVGIIIGNSHAPVFQKFLENYSNLKIGRKFEVGKQLFNYSCKKNDFFENVSKDEIIEELTKKNDLC